MNELANFKIHLEPSPVTSYVEMDGKRLEGVQSISVSCEVGKVSRIHLTMIPGAVDIEGDERLVKLFQASSLDTDSDNHGDDHE